MLNIQINLGNGGQLWMITHKIPFKELKEKMSLQRRAKIAGHAQAILIGMALQELRQTRCLTQ